jgi:hypothetical protein
MAERMIEANGVELCTDAIGDARNPPVLLVMGMSASLVWWEDGFCAQLAGERRFVIRYDHRDTGRSVTYEPGHPPYTVSDLVVDAAGVLDAYELAAAHIVGSVSRSACSRSCSSAPLRSRLASADCRRLRTGSGSSWPRCGSIGRAQRR